MAKKRRPRTTEATELRIVEQLSCPTKRYKINPSLTAMENLWIAARMASYYIMAHSRATNEGVEYDEIVEMLILYGIRHFLKHKIGLRKYNRNFSFFQNVYSSCRSMWNSVITSYTTRLKRRLDTTSLHAKVHDMDDVCLIDELYDGEQELDYRHEIMLADTAPLSQEDRIRHGLVDATPKSEPMAYAKAVYAQLDYDAAMANTTPDDNRDDVYRRIEKMMQTPAYKKYKCEYLSKLKRRKKG